MLKIITILSLFIFTLGNSQESSLLGIKNISTLYSSLNSKKETVIEKQITTIGNFKDWNLEKITLKDLSNNISVNVFGIMTEYETFDTISKRTITFEKPELKSLIESLEILDKNTENRPNLETKYKYQTKNGIEIGTTYNEALKSWEFYHKIAGITFAQSNVKFSKSEFKDLIKTLKRVEQSL